MRPANIRKLDFKESGLSARQWKLLSSLKTPAKIQDYLNSLEFNFQNKRRTCWPVSKSLEEGKAHCVEGALVAACALWIQGQKPLLLDLRTTNDDEDHVVTLFRKGSGWGAISKTNHPVLRYREPVYRDVRELAMSYFHEYFLHSGQKTLRKYSRAYDLSKENMRWISGKNDVFGLVDRLDKSKHYSILSPAQARSLRKAEKIEIKASKNQEFRPKR